MSKKYSIEDKLLTQVTEASKRFSGFGIEQTNFKTDYMHLYVMDMEDNIVGEDYFSQDEIEIVDNRVVDFNIGQHLRDMGFTEGDYKVKYYFLSSLAGLPSIADASGEYGHFYLKENQRPYFGKVKNEIRNNEEYYYYHKMEEGTLEEVPLKKVENKYVLMDINSDRTEVKIDAQNINQEGRYTSYRDKLRRFLQQTAYPKYNFEGSRRDYHLNPQYPAPKIKFDDKDHNVLIIEPQYDGDPGFDPSVIGKAITISDVYKFKGPDFAAEGVAANPALSNPNSPEFQALLAQGLTPPEIIEMSTEVVDTITNSEHYERYSATITEVLDYNRIRVNKSFEEVESELREKLQIKINAAAAKEDVEITYGSYRNGYLINTDIPIFKNNQYITAEDFEQVEDPNRLMASTARPDFNAVASWQRNYRWTAKMDGNSFVVWTPQTRLENLNTYMIVDNQYYLIAQGSEGYGKDGLLYAPWTDGAPTNVLERYFKLYTPLEKEIEPYSLVYFAEEKIEPYEDTIRLIPFVEEEEDLTFLRIPNINSKDNPVRSRRIQYKNFNQITGGNEEVKDKINTKLLSGSLLDTRLNIDYGKRDPMVPRDKNDYGYGTFVNFGSAEKRLSNFKKKLSLIETYTSQSGVFTSISSSGDNTQEYRRLKNNILNSFDHFEHYMYYESSSYVTSSVGEFYSMAWPKEDYVNNKYTLAPTTGSVGTTFYNTWETYAKEYDTWNNQRLVHNIPSHVAMDPSNNTFLEFLDMTAQQFDEIWLYIRHFTDLNERTSRLGEGISKDIVEQVVKSIGLQLENGNDLLSLPEYLLGTNATGSAAYAIPQEDVTKEIYKRILSNMPYFSKTKGSIRALKGLLNCYGIPSSILRVREYGGPDIGGRVSPEIKRKFNYALAFEGTQYVQHTWKTDSISSQFPNTVEFRFKTNNSLGSDAKMAIVQTNDRWAIGTRDNSTDDAYGDLFFALSGSNNSVATCSIDNLPFYNDDMWSVMLTRVSSSGAQLTSASPGSKIKYELTAKQYDATREVILYKGSSFLIADGSGGNNTDGYEQNEYWTTSTNTRLGGNANGKFGSMFKGSLMEYRLWSEPLLESKFDQHVKAPKSYVGNTPSSSYENLVFKLPLNDNISMTNASTLDDKSARTSYEVEATTSGFGGTNKFNSLVDKEEINVPNIGPNRRNATKIRVEAQQLGDRQLTPDTKVAASAYDTAPLDSNKVGIYFSPVDVVNEDIMYSLADFDFDDLVGDPRDEFKLDFRGLENAQRQYWRKYSSPNNFWDYLRILQYYDSGIFEQIRKFVPARANATLGVLIEPNMLERNKEVIGKLPEIDNNYFENARHFDEGLQISNNKSGSDAATLSIGGEFYQIEGSVNAGGYGQETGPNGSLAISTLNVLDQHDPKGPFGNTYLSASITHGGTITEFVETVQPMIDSARLSEHSQVKRLFYNTPEDAAADNPFSSSFHPSEFESMAKESSLFRVYYKPVTLTKKNTIDGKEPVEITITSPTTLISQEPGESPLKVE